MVEHTYKNTNLERAIGGDQYVYPQVEFLATHQQGILNVSGEGVTRRGHRVTMRVYSEDSNKRCDEGRRVGHSDCCITWR